MNPAHLHLLINHIPTLGFIIGVLLLAWAMFRKDESLLDASLIVIVFVAILTIPAYLTGEGAHEAIEKLPGISLGAIALHEEAAELGLWGMEIAGIASLGTLILRKRESKLATFALRVTMVLALIAIILMGRADNAGASIRHGEVSGNQQEIPQTR
jgi:hypothetical protein